MNSLLERDFNFFNIIPYSPGKEKELAADVLDYLDKTGNDTVLYCLSLHPQGFPAMKKALQMVESYRRLKAELKGSGIRLGVLIQSILGHWPRVDKDEEPWTRSINVEGEKVRYCPLDENFKKYIFDVTALLAAESPVFIMGDDDIRGFSPKAECFCELHTAEFNRRTGSNFTPEQYRSAVKNARPGDAVHAAFEKLRREIPEGVAALIRQAIDSVAPQIPALLGVPFQRGSRKNSGGKGPALRYAYLQRQLSGGFRQIFPLHRGPHYGSAECSSGYSDRP